MHEHDQELIMALAEGVLDEEAAAAAQAEIASCPECSADLELQVAAIATLDEAPAVYLTATESARLHAALKEELSLTTPEPRSVRRPIAWSRFLPVAGVAAVLLLVIISLPALFGGQGDDASDETIAAPSFEAGATETTAASMDIQRDGAEEMSGTDNAAAEAAPPSALETTESPAATTTTPAAGDDGGLDGILLAFEFLGPVDELDPAALLDIVLSGDVDLADTTQSLKRIDPFFAECLAESITPEVSSSLGLPTDSTPVTLGIVTTQDGAEAVLVAYVPAEAAEIVFAAALPDCSSITPLP